MSTAEIEATARALVPPGKGILAADESHPSIAKRFEAVGIANTEENRRLYRQMLFTTKGMAEFISGVILCREGDRPWKTKSIAILMSNPRPTIRAADAFGFQRIGLRTPSMRRRKS